MQRATNVVLYAAVAGAFATARVPLASYSPDDKFVMAKVTAKVGEAMREAERSGAPAPDFKLVSETRQADEGGKFVVHAEFRELGLFGAPDGATYGSLADLFSAQNAVAAKVETAEEKAARELAAKSAQLSV